MYGCIDVYLYRSVRVFQGIYVFVSVHLSVFPSLSVSDHVCFLCFYEYVSESLYG